MCVGGVEGTGCQDTLIWFSPLVLFVHRYLCCGGGMKEMMLLIAHPCALFASVKLLPNVLLLLGVVDEF